MPLFKHVRFTLRSTLVTAVVLATSLGIALTVGVIGLPAYTKAKTAIRNLWSDVAKEVSLTASEQIVNYFQKAPISMRMIEGLVEEESLNATDMETILDICYRSLKENRPFVTVYYTKPDGSFYGVFKMGNEYVASHRTINSQGKTVIKNYTIGPDNLWKLKNEEMGDYDPRKRPFWKTATENPDGAWTDPYKFQTTQQTGYSYVLGQKIKGNVVGYWTVDFQLDTLSNYLKSLHVGKKGTIYIIADNKAVIAASAAIKDADQIINWASKSGFINIKNKIVYVNRFSKESKIPWTLITIIHEYDYLRPIRNSAFHSLLLGMIPCILFLFLAGYFFGKMSRRLIEIAKDMDHAGNLSIELKDDIPHSRIREIHMMNHSLHKMQIGLYSFSKYAPLDLIKKLIFSGHAAQLGCEKKEISVLFTDLVQFTTFAEQNNPNQITQVLGDFFQTATQEIHKEKGIIDKFMGDAVMALWGTPDPLPNHPLAACRTALALKKIAALKPNMKFKIGINTGSAMVGNFGSDARMDYTAIGDMVNTAARLEKMNKIYETQILIGPATAEAVQETFLIRPIDFVVPQGKTQSILIYELIDDKKDPIALQAIAAYKAGLDFYRNRQFAQAIPQFEKANTLFGGRDHPCAFLIERCNAYQKNPPPPSWMV